MPWFYEWFQLCFVKMFHCTVSNLELTIRVLAIVAHLEFILAWQIIFLLRLVFFFTKGSLKLLLTIYIYIRTVSSLPLVHLILLWLVCAEIKCNVHVALPKRHITYHKVASSRPVYYSILESFGQRSQYISIKFPLHKHSEKCLDVLLTEKCCSLRLYNSGFKKSWTVSKD